MVTAEGPILIGNREGLNEERTAAKAIVAVQLALQN